MAGQIAPSLIRELLSGARVFAKAVRDVIEGAVLENVAGDKLSTAQFRLLYLVGQTDWVTIGDAAVFLGVSSPAASKTVEKMVRRRLLRRADIQGDRRSSQLSLTEGGRRLIEAYEEARDRKAAEIFSQYAPEVLQHTSELLEALACSIVSRRTGFLKGETCMQCEIYYRPDCRFRQCGDLQCFYQLHRKGQEDARADGGASSEAKKEA